MLPVTLLLRILVNFVIECGLNLRHIVFTLLLVSVCSILTLIFTGKSGFFHILALWYYLLFVSISGDHVAHRFWPDLFTSWLLSFDSELSSDHDARRFCRFLLTSWFHSFASVLTPYQP